MIGADGEDGDEYCLAELKTIDLSNQPRLTRKEIEAEYTNYAKKMDLLTLLTKSNPSDAATAADLTLNSTNSITTQQNSTAEECSASSKQQQQRRHRQRRKSTRSNKKKNSTAAATTTAKLINSSSATGLVRKTSKSKSQPELIFTSSPKSTNKLNNNNKSFLIKQKKMCSDLRSSKTEINQSNGNNNVSWLV
jgi:hypothetical protein